MDQSILKKYDIHPKEQLPSGDTLPWRTWRTANRVRSGQAATPAAKHLWGYRENKHCMCGAATCYLNHIMTSCTHFGEIPSKDDIAEMAVRAVRWMSAGSCRHDMMMTRSSANNITHGGSFQISACSTSMISIKRSGLNADY